MDRQGFGSVVFFIIILFLTVGAAFFAFMPRAQIVLPPDVRITGLDPAEGNVGATVTVHGSGFASQENVVHFGTGYLTDISSSDGTSLRFTVPDVLSLCPAPAVSRAPCAGGVAPPVVPGVYAVRVIAQGSQSNAVDIRVRAKEKEITNFEECVAAGYPVAESSPRQCLGPNGKNFTETAAATPSPSPAARMKKIQTKAGEFTLTFTNGTASLSGVLFRENPCVQWHVDTIISKDIPPSSIEFHVEKTSTAEICIQVIGKPQEVRAETAASGKTVYNVFLQSERVFSGTL